MPTKIAGIVLRSVNKHAVAHFYEKLGLNTEEHEHGGPKHYEMSPLSEQCVFEIYQESSVFKNDTIMLEVDSIEDSLAAVSQFAPTQKTEIRESPSMRLVYITDPEGRDVMLFETK